MADPDIVKLLQNTPKEPQKGAADARYLWPTVVFENVCVCNGNYGGVDCTECDFGWTGNDCSTPKRPVIRKSFASLSPTEQEKFANATRDLKNETGFWSVLVQEPANYSTTANTSLQNVTTYNLFVYLHNYVARDALSCLRVNGNITIDFAHSGPVFPVWHRRYMLIVEKEFQRILRDPTFGFPYWKWEENDMSAFTANYYGIPPNVYSNETVNVTGRIVNPNDWNTVCDLTYRNRTLPCSAYWRVCNPANDTAEQNSLERGNGQSAYLPNIVEVMIAIAANDYDAPNAMGKYFRDDPRNSFRSRLEGWNIICSAANCTGPQDNVTDHMHNLVHDWVGGQMDDVPAAVNDPIFNLHHCNVDRVLESWLQRFAKGDPDPKQLPPYVPLSGAHPGHNRDDYMVPFFPLIRAGDQYRIATAFGYTYDNVIPANIPDADIPDCKDVMFDTTNCPICSANGTCFSTNINDGKCTDSQARTCPKPSTKFGRIIGTTVIRPDPDPSVIDEINPVPGNNRPSIIDGPSIINRQKRVSVDSM